MAIGNSTTLHAITSLGESAFLVPAFLAVALLLFAFGRRRVALLWVLAGALCAGLTFGAKVVFYILYHLADHQALLDVRSPSGHVSLSATFYACGTLLLGSRRGPRTRMLLAIAAALLVVAIAATRMLLGAHSGAEVIVGLAIGGYCASWFGRALRSNPSDAVPWLPLAAAVLVVCVATYGRHIDTEGFLVRAAHQMRDAIWRNIAPIPGAPPDATNADDGELGHGDFSAVTPVKAIKLPLAGAAELAARR
jgi:membrane-associated phospholipid phosphatase